MNSLIILSVLFTLSFSCTVTAQLTQEQLSARKKGIILYHQSAWDSAQPPLKIAAEAGDRQAQYFLGEAIRLNNFYMTPEARKWYEAAAEQGDLYAMLRLSNDDDLCHHLSTCPGMSAEGWREHVLEAAHKRAEQGDAQAMTVLYLAGRGFNWLEKAAEAGDGYAQSLLAGLYKDGRGWFFIPGNRKKAVEKWFKASAESGYPIGMFLYANFLHENNGRQQDIDYWVKQSAEGGYVTAISNYARSLAHLSHPSPHELNLIKAYGLAYLLSELKGGGTAPEDGQRILPMIAQKMNTEEINSGKNFAREWKKAYPPLSYFEPIYGY